METQEKDVNTGAAPESVNPSPDQSVDATQDVNVEETQTHPESQPTEPQQSSQPEPSQDIDVIPLDDRPWKNRAVEAERKLEKLGDQYNTILEKLDANQGQKEAKYSIEELEAFSTQTDNDAHRIWAQKEIRKLEREEGAKVVRNEINAWKSEQQAEATRGQTLQTVINRYPDAFVKDQAGQTIGWNPNSQLAQRIGQYMQDSEIKDNPRGLLAAAAMAYSDLQQTQVVQSQVQQKKLQTEVKDLQKKTLTEGSGVSSPPPPKTPTSSAMERFNSTGHIKDGKDVFKEMLKARGRISEDS